MEQGSDNPSSKALPAAPRIILPVTSDLVGHLIGDKYTLIKLIGRGGMGAVYEARHAQTNKRVAVKLLLSPEFAANESLVRRFYREARASSAIESDHIVQVFDSGSDPSTGFPYMVMEYLTGEDLEHTVNRVGPIEPEAAARIILQALTGLAKAHQEGIIHRDIKPANIYLCIRDTGGLVAKILDFGIAKVRSGLGMLSSGPLNALTHTGSMLGTPLYMSPEHARGASKVDARSDVWSMGVVLYNLLTASHPFEGITALGELLMAIMNDDIAPIQSVAPWVPPELAEIVHTAMTRDISKRYADAGAMRDALAKFVPGPPMVTLEMLHPLDAARRATVASKVAIADDRLRASDAMGAPGALAASVVAPAPARRRSLVLPIAAVSAIALLAGGAAIWRLAPRPQPASAGVVQDPPALVQPAPSAELRAFRLEVAPEGVEVLVDGKPAAVVDGGVEISGPIGATRVVRLKNGSESREETVAVARSGLVPPRAELGAPAATSSAAAPAKVAVKPGAAEKQPSKAGPKDEKTPAPAGTTKGVATDLSEFK